MTLYALVIKAALKVKVASFHAVHGVMSQKTSFMDCFPLACDRGYLASGL
jgi:hypothetical protein